MYMNLYIGTYTRVMCCGNTAEVERQVKGRRSISYNNIIAYLTHTIHMYSECVCVCVCVYDCLYEKYTCKISTYVQRTEV